MLFDLATLALTSFLWLSAGASPLPPAYGRTSNQGPAASNSTNPSYLAKFAQKGVTPEPIRGEDGGYVIAGSSNVEIDQQNPDLLAPPSTDVGTVKNAKWPFSLSHNRLEKGGYAREQNVNVLPVAEQIAGVDMRLKPGAYRELHWHTASEWAYMLKGSASIAVVNTAESGQNFAADINVGDLWYFPAGIPHSIQATDPDVGCEFLLVFDDGTFSEDDTFLITQWTAHVPKEVLNKNFGYDEDNMTTFSHIPADQLYIFEAENPGPISQQDFQLGPGGRTPQTYSYAFSKVEPMQVAGGTIKIADTSNFNISKTIAAAEITIQPGGMRELHWHPNSDEWDYFLSGNFRAGLFASGENTRTFNFQAGDVGYIPKDFGHYLECISETPCHYLEIFKAPKVEDISLQQWAALTPAHVVEDTLRLSKETIANMKTEKQYVVPGKLKKSIA